ncbi:MAG TPA: hypothetical protein VHQ21_03550, partial [Rhodanobacteraceae bacterium]|nr:hypothetical protein [Rhodanobacteraceae bacterium]
MYSPRSDAAVAAVLDFTLASFGDGHKADLDMQRTLASRSQLLRTIRLFFHFFTSRCRASPSRDAGLVLFLTSGPVESASSDRHSNAMKTRQLLVTTIGITGLLSLSAWAQSPPQGLDLKLPTDNAAVDAADVEAVR